jgi:hypothetical protein
VWLHFSRPQRRSSRFRRRRLQRRPRRLLQQLPVAPAACLQGAELGVPLLLLGPTASARTAHACWTPHWQRKRQQAPNLQQSLQSQEPATQQALPWTLRVSKKMHVWMQSSK